MGFIPGGPIYPSALGDFLAAVSNRYSGHFAGSPGAVRMENMLLGIEPFEAALEEKLLLAQYYHQRLDEVEGFTVGPRPDLSIVIFRYNPSRGNINEFNQKLIQAIQEDGRIFLSSTTLSGEFFIRLAVLGVHTHLDAIEDAIGIIKSTATTISQSK
jgi:aromatic-L-amino-acid decarboxylase